MLNPLALPIRYAKGRGNNFAKAKNFTHTWQHFSAQFENPPKSEVTTAGFNAMNDADQAAEKSSRGWWYRTTILGGSRNRASGQPSDLVTLDFDYATKEFFAHARKVLRKMGWACFIHTSRRHTPSKPRFRLVILLNKQVDNDTYGAVSRILARELDPEMAHVDKVSFRPAQMMFLPTVNKDGEYVFERFDGQPVDWQSHLDVFEAVEGDWHDVTKLPTAVGEKNLRETSEKAEDPTEKDGPVGFFCRAYDVEDAIEHFDLPYSRVDMPTGKPRYTYLNGTTTNGAEVQDGGLFLYSHHGSDPTSDMLVNAFDLVRIHKFGHLDKDFDGTGVSPAKAPSWAALIELCEKDQGYISSRMASKYDIDAMFDDLPEDVLAEMAEAGAGAEIAATLAEMVGEVVTPVMAPSDNPIKLTPDGVPYLAKPRKRRPKPPKGWENNLKADQFGNVMSNVSNLAYLFLHDPRFSDSIAFNEFENRPVIYRDIRSKTPVDAAAYGGRTTDGGRMARLP